MFTTPCVDNRALQQCTQGADIWKMKGRWTFWDKNLYMTAYCRFWVPRTIYYTLLTDTAAIFQVLVNNVLAQPLYLCLPGWHSNLLQDPGRTHSSCSGRSPVSHQEASDSSRQGSVSSRPHQFPFSLICFFFSWDTLRNSARSQWTKFKKAIPAALNAVSSTTIWRHLQRLSICHYISARPRLLYLRLYLLSTCY